MHVYRNIKARSYNCCCSGKAISVKCSECVFVALGIQNPMSMRHMVICNLSGSTVFFTLSPTGPIFEKKKAIEH
jgi:hypothetical protein